MNNRNVVLTVLKARSLLAGCQHGGGLRILSWVLEGTQELSGLLYKGRNFIHTGSALTT